VACLTAIRRWVLITAAFERVMWKYLNLGRSLIYKNVGPFSRFSIYFPAQKSGPELVRDRLEATQ
jgi:hypothetical protein